MIYRVRHSTVYEYSRRVELGSHLTHLLPRGMPPYQRLLSSTLDVSPEVSFRREERDHFGNAIVWLSIERPHTRLEVVAHSEVEVLFPVAPDDSETPSWERVRDLVASGEGGAWRAAEFTAPSPMLPLSAVAAEYARASFPPGRPLLACARDLNGRIHRDFRFRAGATTLRTTVGDLLRIRAGVCQDFAHLTIAGLRGLGLPARYMSGYIRTYASPGAEKRPGSDVSHAWVGVWLGPSLGWIGLDPTNDLVVRDEHVVLGWGRDFSDVSPLFGVILGGGRHTLKVGVDLEPVAPGG